eukprot:GSChrysophyteH1.ASY1.ANO1.3051.1 assembled CDS
MVSEQMRVSDYEKLMMCGWRRSGTYFYKPCMFATCCPMYTIRLPVAEFTANKAQRQLLRRIDRYLHTGSVLEDKGHAKDVPAAYAIETVVATYTDEVFELYKKYQIAVHDDDEKDLTPDGFRRFLVESPLLPDSETTELNPQGTHHQLHRLDGQLIAVGVVDLLSIGLSSVYLFYDPEFRDLVLGKYSAMREIEWCKERGLPYYYMGYYIHDCHKMKYKAEYSPSELLCPVTFSWRKHAEVLPLLNTGFVFTPLEPKYAALREKLGMVPTDIAITARKAARKQVLEECASSGKEASKERPPVGDLAVADADKFIQDHELRSMRPRFQKLDGFKGVLNKTYFLYEGMVKISELRQPGQNRVAKVVTQFVECVGEAFLDSVNIRLA